jgi:hypothetical protein
LKNSRRKQTRRFFSSTKFFIVSFSPFQPVVPSTSGTFGNQTRFDVFSHGFGDRKINRRVRAF